VTGENKKIGTGLPDGMFIKPKIPIWVTFGGIHI
jgi:hypothetical protein